MDLPHHSHLLPSPGLFTKQNQPISLKTPSPTPEILSIPTFNPLCASNTSPPVIDPQHPFIRRGLRSATSGIVTGTLVGFLALLLLPSSISSPSIPPRPSFRGLGPPNGYGGYPARRARSHTHNPPSQNHHHHQRTLGYEHSHHHHHYMCHPSATHPGSQASSETTTSLERKPQHERCRDTTLQQLSLDRPPVGKGVRASEPESATTGGEQRRSNEEG